MRPFVCALSLVLLALGCSVSPTEPVAKAPASSPALEQGRAREELGRQPRPVSERPYDRQAWAGWIDEDGDCQDTRTEILVAEAVGELELDPSGCKVLRGQWRCPYTGQLASDPSELDVDHLVPLANAHRSGGAAWGPRQCHFREGVASPLWGSSGSRAGIVPPRYAERR